MFETLSESYRFRALLGALVGRHLAARYRGAVLGFVWSLLNPICLVGVYTLVFHYYARMPNVTNYPVFVFAGLLPWIWFSSTLLEGVNSIVSSGHLVTKSMFPAHILPSVVVITNLVHYLLALPVLFALMYLTGASFHFTLIYLPLLILLQVVLLIGLTHFFSSLNVTFRDIQHVLGNSLTLIFFLCPIIYPVSMVPQAFRFSVDWNPLALLIVEYQNCIVNGIPPSLRDLVIIFGAALFSYFIGTVTYFAKRERFAEAL